MSEIALVIVTLAQTGLIWYLLNSQKEERAKLINALVAKNSEEMINLEVLDKNKPQKKQKVDEILTPIENLSDDEFKKLVLDS